MNARQKVLTGPLADIEVKTKEYADAREVLAQRMIALNDELASLKARRLNGIKTALAAAAELEADLKAAIEAAPAAFEKPRTQIFHGIKVGYRKGTGKVTFEDADQVVKLIRKHFPEQADLLIKVEETPIKKAIGDLAASDVKKIGCSIEDAADAVEIKPVDGAVEKMVNALLKEAASEAEGE